MEIIMKKRIVLSLLIASSLFADAELDAIKEQLQEQKEATLALSAKLNSLEQKNTNESASFSQNAYLPDMAFILNMSALGRNVNNDEYAAYELPGFINVPDTPDLPFNANRGFNFNYAEVALHSVVDPYFEAFAIFHISPEELEIEEAYVQTTSLPYSLKIKAGKFKSNFGRLNEQHHHVWNFDSQPLIYKGLFGPDGISDAGIQLQWIAPTDTYLMFGAEAMQGSNERSFGDTSANNLYIGYVKSSVDLGDDLSILGGLSYAHGKNTDAKPTDIYGADLTLREQLGSYSAIIWQSEYLQRDKQLSTREDKQSGLYSELVYQYNNNYSFGARYDLITNNETDLSAYNGVDTDNLDRYTAKIDYKPFPMSRLRLSYTYDRSKVIAGERKDINEVMLSLNIAAGAHGAHNY
jgi:hypothetical protein